MTNDLAAGFVEQLAQDLGAEDLALVVATFRSDVERLTTMLKEQAGTGDTEGFRRAAHALAGAAAAVGATTLEHACRAIMTRPRLGAADLAPAAAALSALGQQARAALEAAVARLVGGARA